MDRAHKKWWILVAICLIFVMLSIDATAVNIAIPVIAGEFHANLSSMQWVINAFFLLAAMVQILGGHLGDTYSHKRIFLITLLLFVISSAGAGFAVNEEMLITFRALQGATAGIATPLSFALIAEAFPQETQSFARSFIVATMGMALAAGSPIGGVFVHTIGWRWIFFINIPIGLICFFLVLANSKKSKVTHKGSFDLKGMILVMLPLFFIAFAFNEVQNWGFVSWYFLGFIVLGLLFLVLLYYNESKQAKPVFDFSIFKSGRFSLNSLIRVINQLIFLGILFFVPLYLQNIEGQTAIVSGLVMLALTVIMCIISPFAGKWVDQRGERDANILSMVLMIIGSFLMLFFKSVPNFTLITIALILYGIAIATIYTSTTTGAFAVAKKNNLGIVSGIFLTIAWLACSLGVSLAGTTIAYVSKSSLNSQLSREEISVHGEAANTAFRAAQGLAPAESVKNTQVREMARTAFTRSIHVNGLIYLCLAAMGLVLAFFTKSLSRILK